MRLAILAPCLPPEVNGVGDHAALLGEALSRRHSVWQLTAAAEASDRFRYGDGFGPGAAARVLGFLGAARIQALLVEYVPFLYSPSGICPALPRLLREAARRRVPSLLVVHEPFVPRSLHPVRSLRSIAQRLQLRALVRASAAVATVCDGWSDFVRPWVPAGRPGPVLIPVGSNIPRLPPDDAGRRALRARLGIPEGSPACAFFGSTHPSHLTGWVARAAAGIPGMGTDLHLVVLGAAAGSWPGPDGPRLHRLGVLPAAEVSRTLQACDLQAAPYLDGVSARRTAAMAGLEHGLPVVSTRGRFTDRSLPWERHLPLAEASDEAGFATLLGRLAAEPAERARWAASGTAFHREHLDRERLAARYERMLEALVSFRPISIRLSESARGKAPESPRG